MRAMIDFDLHRRKRDERKARRAAVYARTADIYQQIDSFFATVNDGLFAVISVLAIVMVIGITSRVAQIIESAQVEASEPAQTPAIGQPLSFDAP
jgi:hypothetical protein